MQTNPVAGADAAVAVFTITKLGPKPNLTLYLYQKIETEQKNPLLLLSFLGLLFL